jgi:Family of unknown function (DUF6252)
MRPPRIGLREALAPLAWFVAACSSSSPATDATGGHGTITCTIDGTAFTSVGDVIATRASGLVSISGGDATSRIVALALAAPAAGTYQIGGLEGANGQVRVGTQAWQAVAPGSGTIVIQTLTATAVSGTFGFTAPALTSTGATGTKIVASGTFDASF